MAQIDSLSPEERSVVRLASVFGLTFHPRMLAWFADQEEISTPSPAVWSALSDLFDEEPDGYLRFRRTLLRDAAYEGLPYKLRRKLHGAVAAHLEEEMDYPDDVADILSLHYFEAGEYSSAWRYGLAAAKRAESAYANVEAAGFYSRALEAGRQLGDLAQTELAAARQALGDAWYRASEFRKAGDAYAATRPLVTSEPLTDADLLIKLSRVEEKLGNYVEALRWTDQARDILQKLPGPEAIQKTARSCAWYATLLQYSGRTTEALEWAERAVAEAESADDPEALGESCWVKGWIYGDLGKEGAQESMQRSLEAFQRAGNLVRLPGVLLSLGAVCHWAGRWDEALSYWDRARGEALKIGSTIYAALARINFAEILVDRGEWAEAEALLVETLPFWKASQYHYHLGFCLLLLGRVSLRLGRPDGALARFDEARASFLHVGAEEEIPAVDARIAECRVTMGNLEAGLELVQSMLGRASASNALAKVVPLLERIQGHALLKQDDLWGARDALEASLASARERKDIFEATLTMLSLIELDRLEGIEPPHEMVNESRSSLSNLKVRAVPPVPLPPR
jgi:tetratricopeptide (TPR) repeat protein